MKTTSLVLLWCVVMAILWGLITLRVIERALMHAL